MAYDEDLATRVRAKLAPAGFSERKMFGGLAFMVSGHMCCGVVGSDLMVRVGADAYERALARKGARVMDFTGRPMKGIVFVSADALVGSRALKSWVDLGLRYVATLPSRA